MGYSIDESARRATAQRQTVTWLLCLCLAIAVRADAQETSAFQLRGRFDADGLITTQSAANEAIFGDLGDAIGVRRAWIGAEGSLARGRYVTIIDLASGDVVLRDVFLGIGETDSGGEIRVGHHLEPFSLELGTPSFTLPFMECSLASLLDPARNWGVSLFRSQTDNSHFALGVFQAGSDANDFDTGPGSTIALTGRFTATPVLEEEAERLLHLGAALSSRFAERGLIVVNQQPQSPLLDLGDTAASPFVPTIRVPADFQQLANLQFAAARGPLWTQAEWSGSWIDQQGGEVVFFHGYYVECGCFVTGEHRAYQGATGALGPVRVERPVIRCRHHDHDCETGWGAWELAARYSYVDFMDADTPLGPGGELVGIRLPEATFGVNWYLTDHMRLMFNYSYAVPQEPNLGTSVANIFAMRLGVFW